MNEELINWIILTSNNFTPVYPLGVEPVMASGVCLIDMLGRVICF